MTSPLTGLFVAEGTSDLPLGDLVRRLFAAAGVPVDLTSPDFGLLADRVPRDVASRLRAGQRLLDRDLDLVVVHRDVDRMTVEERRAEIEQAMAKTGIEAQLVRVLPVRMTEALLLLDEAAIRMVAGNPNGRSDLRLPARGEVERIADPKAFLQRCLLDAADVTGRRRERFTERFSNNRRLLLERLDPFGPVNALSSWKALRADVERVAQMPHPS